MPDKKIILLSFTGLGLVTALITIIAVSLSRPDSAEVTGNGYMLLPDGGDPLEDMKYPSERHAAREYFSRGPDLYRVPKENWSQEDISRFWLDPRIIALEYLEKENRNYLEEMFESIP
ncbi:MAG: hypothetical protein ACLFST_15255 [Spirochaetia bacterium]